MSGFEYIQIVLTNGETLQNRLVNGGLATVKSDDLRAHIKYNGQNFPFNLDQLERMRDALPDVAAEYLDRDDVLEFLAVENKDAQQIGRAIRHLKTAIIDIKTRQASIQDWFEAILPENLPVM